MKPTALALSCLLALPVLAQATPSNDDAAIHAVIEKFRSAIVHKDKPGFLALFASSPVTWRTVYGDAMLQAIKQRHPEATKAPYDARENYSRFIDLVSSHKGPVEESFDHIRIDSDGDVASVNFDYTFRMDNRETNRGQESWQLLRTDDGWRIVSVVWSTHRPPAH